MPWAGYWAPLSGKVEPGESQFDAVVREVKEEVGLTVQPLRKVWEYISDSGTHLLHWWLARYVSGDVIAAEREVSEARWLTVDEFLQMTPTFACDREFFRDVFPQTLTH
ncbi:MAG: hypothetical protein ETSY2_24430 [Candidatus Entotheonella gemina]|uniref:Nudix hydrolase domain-containing protein n=1 Tax=Candidatus Entotheonella gemina TaxID=1429439 RepID=W4M4A8_9BACT|nr:MAG: hypothetical protein ETSY2_24430 [Candidatus Entotheonella gemina]